MASLRAYLARAAAFAETRGGALAAFGAALVVWWIQAIAMPLAGGRDFGTYLGALIELFQSDPIDLGYVLGRTPLAPLVMGALLVPFGGALAEPLMSLLYAASILAWFLAARRFGGGAALVTVVVLLAYPGYGILFHELGSDSLFAAAFAGWSLLAVRVVERPTTWGFVLLGSGVAALTLVRPGNQVLIVLAVMAFALGASWRARVTWAAAFVVPVVVILGAWTVHNGVRFHDYTIARGGSAFLFYRTFLVDRIVRPDNGPASRALARAVASDLLPYAPYRPYGVTMEQFFEDPSPRMLEDIGALVNRRWGWSTDQKIVGEAAREAVRTHPGTYARGVASTSLAFLRKPLFRAPASTGDRGDERSAQDDPGQDDFIVINGRRLPRPSEGEPIPAAREGGVATPDGSIRTVWTSDYEHHLVFEHPGDEQRYDALHRRMTELSEHLPDRSGVATLALRLNQASRWFPPPIVWLLVGVVALVARRPQRALVLTVPAIAGLLVILLTSLGLPAVPHYSVPVAPAFVLLMAGALLAPRRE
jgi:hypothetical protein